MNNISPFPSSNRDPPAILPVIPDIPKQVVIDYLNAFGYASQLSENEKLQFIEIAQAFHVNPFKQEIHVAVFGEGEYRRLSIITGYEVYLKRAERTGKLDGWRAWIEGDGTTMKAIVEIHRKDWSEPFVHDVYFPEALQKKRDGAPTSFWTKQPRFQLKKVAISQGFRLAFPDELGGMPYDASELPDNESIIPVIPKVQDDTSPIQVTLHSVHPEDSTAKIKSPTHIPPVSPSTLNQVHQDRYADEPVPLLLNRLEHYLDDNYSAFTERHRDWVFEKAKKAATHEGVIKMLSYAEKVIRNGNAVAGVSA